MFVFSLIVVFCIILVSHYIWVHTSPIKGQSADVLIVLGYKCEDDQIHSLLKERLDTAIYLFENYQYEYILLSGGAVTSKKTEAAIMRDYLIHNHIPEDSILLENKSQNTIYNIIYCKEIMDKYRLTSSVIVSNSFHLRRVMVISRAFQLQATYYAKRNISTLLQQCQLTFKEFFIYRLTNVAIKRVRQ